ncbi:MAG TPA: ComEC/Rec2 family competence protein [Candidatus Paceibacterota bacterium]|nr:ComEC/Rec2 family competence protein [Candidatus Pacearchaeota archaeon]HRZ50699.1 ComEC/Rec2 family competence protein [Candidatus Paceibacterota bacterium]HSA36404.1 ComEC/Rec2 family competence protein [Candidatus Paceibacterota bacterium]
MPAAKIFLYSCLAVCFGVLLASFFQVTALAALLYCMAVFLLFFSSLAAKKPGLAVWAVFLVFFGLGFWRFEQAWWAMEHNELSTLNGSSREFVALVDSEPQVGDSQKVVVRPEGYEGRILVIAYRYPEYQYGDKLKISGTLQEPPVFDGFDYRLYLLKSGIFSVMNGPAVEKLESNKGSSFYAGLLAAKAGLRQSLNQALPYPHNALLAGILFGDQNGLPQCSQKEKEAAEEEGNSCLKLKEEFNISGLRHLTAVSGMHIAIMLPILIGLGLGLGLWRSQAAAFAVAVIWVFILMIGLPASAVRAGIMGTLMMAAQAFGRPASQSRLVVLAAVFMVMLDPLLLRFDIGFQLSFLAVMGMIYLAPEISEVLASLISWPDLRNVLAQTLAAQVFTLPVLIFNFGYISLYAPLANILAVPVITILTIIGFVLSAAGLVSSGAAWIISLPVWLLCEYLIRIAGFAAGLPYAALNLNIHWLFLAFFYAILWVITARLHDKRISRFLGF